MRRAHSFAVLGVVLGLLLVPVVPMPAAADTCAGHEDVGGGCTGTTSMIGSVPTFNCADDTDIWPRCVAADAKIPVSSFCDQNEVCVAEVQLTGYAAGWLEPGNIHIYYEIWPPAECPGPHSGPWGWGGGTHTLTCYIFGSRGSCEHLQVNVWGRAKGIGYIVLNQTTVDQFYRTGLERWSDELQYESQVCWE